MPGTVAPVPEFTMVIVTPPAGLVLFVLVTRPPRVPLTTGPSGMSGGLVVWLPVTTMEMGALLP